MHPAGLPKIRLLQSLSFRVRWIGPDHQEIFLKDFTIDMPLACFHSLAHCLAHSMCSIKLFPWMNKNGSFVDCFESYRKWPMDKALWFGWSKLIRFPLRRWADGMSQHQDVWVSWLAFLHRPSLSEKVEWGLKSIEKTLGKSIFQGKGSEKKKNRCRDFPSGPVVKNPPVSAGKTGSIPGPGRSHMPRGN